MICPNCKCEYIRGVTECADCGVALVDKLEPPDVNSDEDLRIVSIWRGNDPAEYAGVQEALEKAHIPFTTPDSKSYFSFLPTEGRLEIWVSEADQEEARNIILDLEGRVDPDELTPEEIESLALPELNDDQSGEESSQWEELAGDWQEDDPAVEAWSGDSEPLANNLVTCLREIGVASRKVSEAGKWRLVVRPEQESRAKEVVREVVEASPPQ